MESNHRDCHMGHSIIMSICIKAINDVRYNHNNLYQLHLSEIID